MNVTLYQVALLLFFKPFIYPTKAGEPSVQLPSLAPGAGGQAMAVAPCPDHPGGPAGQSWPRGSPVPQ